MHATEAWPPNEKYGVVKKKVCHKSEKNALKNEDDLAELEIWYMCNNIMVNIFTKKNICLMLLYIAYMAIWMSNFDNFDIDQKPSKFAQR